MLEFQKEQLDTQEKLLSVFEESNKDHKELMTKLIDNLCLKSNYKIKLFIF